MLADNRIKSARHLKASGIVIILLLLLGAGSLGLIEVHGQSGTPALQNGPTLLSGSATTAKEPAVSTSANGQWIFVAWTQGSGGIYFTASSNGGSSFTTPMKISKPKGTTQFPVMASGDGFQSASPGDVYVAWAQTVSGTLQIFVASSTNNGSKFTVTQVSTQGGITPALAASGSNVYVTWNQNTPCGETALNPLNTTTGLGVNACDMADMSTNNGATWSTPVELNPSTGGEMQIVATGGAAFAVGDLGYYASFNSTTSNWYGNGTTLTGWSTPLFIYGYYFYDPTNASMNCDTLPNTPPTGCLISYSREPWVAASGSDVYITWEAVNLSSTTGLYSDYGITSTDGGQTWYPGTCDAVACPGSQITTFPPVITTPAQEAPFSVSRQASDTWEPENAAYGSSAFLTVHSLSNQGVYVSSTANNGSTWSKPFEVNSGMKGTSAFGHIFTSDGTNVWVMWGQKISGSSSVWNAYVSYSGNNGTTWSPPLDISNNVAGVAAGNQDVTLFWVASFGATSYAVWTYTNGGTSQVMFASITV
jgi:hypothetical protein